MMRNGAPRWSHFGLRRRTIVSTILVGLLLIPGWEAEDIPTPNRTAESAERPTGGASPSSRSKLGPENEAALRRTNPFQRRIRAPEFPRGMEWINTGGPLRLHDLKGKFVLLDFWTYCCINCMHILPELKKLEQAYADQLVVIGVHSAKFETERDGVNIGEAVLRYEMEHPVVNDAQMRIWKMFRVSSWPTVYLIDPEGYVVYGRSGEFQAEEIDSVLKRAIPYYRYRKLLDERPVHFNLLAHQQEPTPLRFPGKVLADEETDRLYIADSNHNRIVVTTLDGRRVDVIGTGDVGMADGKLDQATFNHPQGMALAKETLYVADTENHLIRKVELGSGTVTTVAGTGSQARVGGSRRRRRLPARKAALNSPWDLWIRGDALFIAMAGPHQIWTMSLSKPFVGPYAGNGREDIVDGPLDESSFAQPSGLASDGQRLYVADSEGSSIRAVPFQGNRNVETVVGTAALPQNRLFVFGDRDGSVGQALLQHPLGVVYHNGLLYVADTYNNKIKAIDPARGVVRTIAGTGEPGDDDTTGTFDEPAGISYAAGKLYVADTNNHRIRTIDLRHGNRVSTLEIPGLEPPPSPAPSGLAPLAGALTIPVPPQPVSPTHGELTIHVKLQLPDGWKINPLAPMRYVVQSDRPDGAAQRGSLGTVRPVEPPADQFTFSLPIRGRGSDELRVTLNYYYCQEGAEGLCKVGSVIWKAPIQVTQPPGQSTVQLEHTVEP